MSQRGLSANAGLLQLLSIQAGLSEPAVSHSYMHLSATAPCTGAENFQQDTCPAGLDICRCEHYWTSASSSSSSSTHIHPTRASGRQPHCEKESLHSGAGVSKGYHATTGSNTHGYPAVLCETDSSRQKKSWQVTGHQASKA